MDTGLFYADGGWIHTTQFAHHFPDKEEAEKVVLRHKIKNADLVTLNELGRVIGGKPIQISN